MNLASSSSSTDLDGIDSMLDWFGVDKAVKDRLKERNTALTKEDITIDEDHPPAEALGSNISKFKSFFTCEAWESISKSMARLAGDWRCDTCKRSHYENMIMCESCFCWHHWACAKLSSPPDQWYCATCTSKHKKKT